MKKKQIPDTLNRRKFKKIRFAYQNLSLEDMDGELWVDIEGFEGYYQVSNMGRIKSLPRKWISGNSVREYKKPFIRKQSMHDRGYCQVLLRKYNILKNYKTHVLVGKYFVPNPSNLPEINHKRGVKLDNRFHQLEWCTPLENVRHAIAMGLKKPSYGIKNGMAKLTNKQVKEIFNSNTPSRATAKKYKVSKNLILRIRSRETWGHLTKNLPIPVGRLKPNGVL